MKYKNYEENFLNGIWAHEYKSYSPFYLGIFNAYSKKLGGEEKFLDCADFISGICDFDFWIMEKVNLLTTEEKELLEKILYRNKMIDEYLNNIKIENVDKLNWCRLDNTDKLYFCYLYDVLTKKDNLLNYIIENNIDMSLTCMWKFIKDKILSHQMKKQEIINNKLKDEFISCNNDVELLSLLGIK